MDLVPKVLLKSRTIAAIDVGSELLFELLTLDEIISCAAMIFNHDEDPRVAFGAPSLTIASPDARSVMLLRGPGVGALDVLGDNVDDG